MDRLLLALALAAAAALAACSAPRPPAPAPLAAVAVPTAASLPSARRARRLLTAQGYGDVGRLHHIGDYWQGKALWHGKQVTAYLLQDGEILHEPPLIGAP